MLQVRCSGSPREIGYTHGSEAKARVKGSISFYSNLFQERCSMNWDAVRQEASQYVHPLEEICPRYIEETRGLAEGAGVDFLDVLALNVRTEIMFGLFTEPGGVNGKAVDDIPSDGCTSLGFVDDKGESVIGQSWDWEHLQGPNLIVCHISQPGTKHPDISMVTEAGIIGKIGFNSAGVGCCLNAIRARGVDRTKLPVHFALRTVLESSSRKEAIEQLTTLGLAGSGHILVGDGGGATGLECTVAGIQKVLMNNNKVFHTNHLILDHSGVDEPPWLKDSSERLNRIRSLADVAITGSGHDFEKLLDMFKDEQGYPCSINRKQEGESRAQTLFTIIMNLSKKHALVKFGRPSEKGEEIRLVF
ncbi:hypothetical protein VP1G_08632 [Cytospora mali]|uniref:Peptidase C45 hydrolase domain-containing protein n=1 Tax=Cytospora mali TaxID=578113 RepID=A0A194VBS5_CYTMA|nr:hypothetical protein VP1G_08632 [Valsa mali var. pyri (nom. inval.)]